MAKLGALRDCYIAINGTVVSNQANSVGLEDSADEIDLTGFSTGGYREITQGLKDATLTCTFFSDFGTPAVNAGINNIIQPLYASGGTLGIEVRPTSAAVSSTNPKMTATVKVFSYAGLTGGIGDAATFDCAFRNAGTLGFVWGTV